MSRRSPSFYTVVVNEQELMSRWGIERRGVAKEALRRIAVRGWVENE